MPRWVKVMRGMIGTGLTFAAGVGGLVSIVGAFVWLGGRITGRELVGVAGKFSVAAFLLGVAFSGVLAIAARGRLFDKLSLRLVGGVGAGAGLLYWVFLALNGGRNWSARDAIGNFVLLLVMGVGAATATLLIARKAGATLKSRDDLDALRAGEEEIVQSRRSAKVELPRR